MSKLTTLTIVIAGIFAIWAGTAVASLIGNNVSGVSPVVPCVSPPPGMVAWWPLDETNGATVVTDVSGGGHNGTPQQAAVAPIGPPPRGPAPGTSPQLVPPAVVGGSLYFYTNQTYVQVPNQAPLEPGGGDFSIAGWVYPVQVGTGQVQPIVDKFDGAPTNMGYALYIQSPGIVNNARLNFVYGDGSLNLAVQSISPIAYTQWHHVAVTVKRTLSPPPGGKYVEVQLYVDGAAQGSQQVGNPVASIATNLDLLIGGTRISPAGFGEIGIDEVQLFNRALSSSEIADIQHAGSAGKCTPTPHSDVPTATPTPCGAVGVICTPTPTATICIGGPVPCTPTPTRTPTPHSDVPTATPTHCANGTICTPTPTATICIGAAGPCTPTPTVTRTPTPHSDVPTATPTHCGAIGAICTPTPTVTRTPTRPPDVPTATPTHCGAIGAICTPTPTRTPTHVSDAPTPTRTRTPTPHKACGDVNDDGRVNSIDANFLLQLVVGRIAHLPNFASADTNHDGSVNSIDATLVLQKDAGLLPALQCG